MKRLLSALLALSMVLAFAGCGPSEKEPPASDLAPAPSASPSAPAESGKITVLTQMFQEPAQQQYVKEVLLPRFKEQTGVDVELQIVPNASELYQSLEAQKATGNWNCDVILAHDSVAPTIVSQYDAVAAYDWMPEGEFITQFDQNFVVDGTRYFIPLQADVYMTIVNKKALPYLDQLGYDINELTWDQMVEWVNKIKADTGAPRYVFPAVSGKYAAYEFNAIQLAYGCGSVPVFDTPEAKAAFDVVVRMKDGILPSSPTIDFPTVPLGSEEAWITVFHQAFANTTYSQSPDKFILAPVPKGPDGSRGTIAGGHGIGIVKESKNPESARKFVEFLVEDQNMYDLMKNLGPLIPTKQSILDQLGDNPDDTIIKMGLATLSGDTKIDRVRSDEYQDFGLVKKIYEDMFADILSGKELTQDYLNGKQAELDKIRK